MLNEIGPGPIESSTDRYKTSATSPKLKINLHIHKTHRHSPLRKKSQHFFSVGKMNPFWRRTYFSKGLVQPPTSNRLVSGKALHDAVCALGLTRYFGVPFLPKWAPRGIFQLERAEAFPLTVGVTKKNGQNLQVHFLWKVEKLQFKRLELPTLSHFALFWGINPLKCLDFSSVTPLVWPFHGRGFWNDHRFWNRKLAWLVYHIDVYIYIFIPGTQMTLLLVWKGLVLKSWPSKIEVIWVPGIYIHIDLQCTSTKYWTCINETVYFSVYRIHAMHIHSKSFNYTHCSMGWRVLWDLADRFGKLKLQPETNLSNEKGAPGLV